MEKETHPAYGKKENIERNHLNQDSNGCQSRYQHINNGTIKKGKHDSCQRSVSVVEKQDNKETGLAGFEQAFAPRTETKKKEIKLGCMSGAHTLRYLQKDANVAIRKLLKLAQHFDSD